MEEQNFIASLNFSNLNSKNIILLKKEMLSLERLKLINNSFAKINILKLLYEIPLALRENFNQFKTFISQEQESNNWLDVNVINNMNVEANRLIFNILASIPIVQEYYKNKLLNNKYEQEFKPRLQQFHLNSMEYAFLYCLRNYSTHYFVPVTKGNFTFDNEFKTKIQFYINKSTLFEKKNYWSDKIIKRLNNMPEEINIVNIILKGIPDFLEFLSTYLKEYYADMEDSIRLFKELNSVYNPSQSSNIIICTSSDPSFQNMSVLTPCTYVNELDEIFQKDNIYI